MSEPAAWRPCGDLRRLSCVDRRECCDDALLADDDDDELLELLELDALRFDLCDVDGSCDCVECCVAAVCCELCDLVDLLVLLFLSSSLFFFGARIGDIVG